MSELVAPPPPGGEPLAIDLSVDAALVLKALVKIDAYPEVLVLMPNIFRPEDQQRVHDVVLGELTQAGIVCDGHVNPVIERWLHTLHRPDVELAAHIATVDSDKQLQSMLRLSLVRRGSEHILALRCDDRVVIQAIFHTGHKLDILTAAITAALGPCPPLGFETLTATFEQFAAVPSTPEARRRALLELGATAHTAAVLTRAMDNIRQRAEIVAIEHHDGRISKPEFSLAVLDTPLGRIVVTPSRALDEGTWSTYHRGDDSAIGAGIARLIELLPRGSWFDVSRSD